MDVCSAARGLMEAPKWDAGFPRTSSTCEQIKMFPRKLVHRKVQCFKTLLYCRGTLRCQAARKNPPVQGYVQTQGSTVSSRLRICLRV